MGGAHLSVDRVLRIADIESTQLGIEALTAEAQQFSRCRPIVLSQFECRFNAQRFNHVGGFPHQLFEGHSPDPACDLLDRPARTLRPQPRRHSQVLLPVQVPRLPLLHRPVLMLLNHLMMKMTQ